jgi:multiple antibiotic resistance protein
MNQYTQAIVTVLSLVNPVICGMLFAQAVESKSRTAQIADATKASLVVVAILCFAALAGSQLLKLFGISLDAFQVAGGMVLASMGFLMLRGASSPAPSEKGEDTKPSLILLILFAASPGTITGVITLSVAHSPSKIPVTALVAVVVALAVTWVMMVFAARSAKGKKQGLMHDVSTRFMGLIVLAMGVQFALSGLKTFFTLH